MRSAHLDSRLRCEVMPDDEGGWRVYGERAAYDNRWVRVNLVDVRAPHGERFEYHVVELAPIAIALIVNDRDEVPLLWKYRFPTRQWGYEMPGGMVDDGEHSALSAAREAAEESGWEVSGEPEHLLSVEPLPGQVRAKTDVYVRRTATYAGPPSDPEEVATEIAWVAVDRIPALVRDGRILGSSTALGLLHYYTLRQEQPGGGYE